MKIFENFDTFNINYQPQCNAKTTVVTHTTDKQLPYLQIIQPFLKTNFI